MRNSTHARSGRVAWLAAAPLVPAIGAGLDITAGFDGSAWVLFLLGLVVANVVARWPNVDHPRSAVGSKVPPISWLVRKVCGGHRGGMHSFVSIGFAFLLGGFIGFFLAPFFLAAAPATTVIGIFATAAAVGWAAHIAGDMPTTQGCMLLWPFYRRHIRFGRLRTSDPRPAPMRSGEAVLNVALILAQIVLICTVIGGVNLW